ncbi:OmpH family outer membrane protein [Parvularcula sp. LCG005]|uniref:OmpH family outer membrane protein n=1 Tax=Parvularcula sp. LCG005 TaxID=3078805 RepID=UPI002943BEBE|nr:hypothetical protein [Parvularcula sp. LCG005]WOI54721.1 hypothetical protein RUI03_06880 [Parvularcula sp. LCG005]
MVARILTMLVASLSMMAATAQAQNFAFADKARVYQGSDLTDEMIAAEADLKSRQRAKLNLKQNSHRETLEKLYNSNKALTPEQEMERDAMIAEHQAKMLELQETYLNQIRSTSDRHRRLWDYAYLQAVSDIRRSEGLDVIFKSESIASIEADKDVTDKVIERMKAYPLSELNRRGL